MVAGGEDRRGRGPFPGLRRGRPIGFSGASCCARMSLREIWPASNVHRTRPREGSSTIGASRLSSPGFRRLARAVRRLPSGSRHLRRGHRHERRPLVPTLGLRVYVGSSRVREGFPRLGPRPLGLRSAGWRADHCSLPPTRRLVRSARGGSWGRRERGLGFLHTACCVRLKCYACSDEAATKISNFKPSRRSNTRAARGSARSARRERRREWQRPDRGATP